jgi:hypothetical protein
MPPMNATASRRITIVEFPDMEFVRTYRQIAEVLVERGDRHMTPTRVARICQRAQRKITEALWLDSYFRRQLRRSDWEPRSRPPEANADDEPWNPVMY